MKYTNKLLTVILMSFSSLVFSANEGIATNNIQTIIPLLEKALNEIDIDTLQTIYSSSATVIPKDTVALKTRLDIKSYWNHELEVNGARFMIDAVDYYVKEDLAYVSALWTSIFFIKNAHINGGAEAIITDGYLHNILYRLDDGSWKILIQQWY